MDVNCKCKMFQVILLIIALMSASCIETSDRANVPKVCSLYDILFNDGNCDVKEVVLPPACVPHCACPGNSSIIYVFT